MPLSACLIVMPDLLNATRDYWRKLDELEAAYQRGDVSLKEVDATVQTLMQELGRSRRLALRAFARQIGLFWQNQRDTIVATVLIGCLTYAWVVVS